MVQIKLPNPSTQQHRTQSGAAIIEWVFVAVLFVVILTGFFTWVLPKLLAYATRTSVETAILSRLSLAPPQLAIVTGEGQPENGLAPLNLMDPAAFDYRVSMFLSNIRSTANPEIELYGFSPDDFEYCLALKDRGVFQTELIGGQSVMLTRSSRGEGTRCEERFNAVLGNPAADQWALHLPDTDQDRFSIIQSAFAQPVSQFYVAIVAALDDSGLVCSTSSPCIGAGPVAVSSEPLPPPDVTPLASVTATIPPTATPPATSTPIETPTATVPPTDTPEPTPSATAEPSEIPTETPIATEVPTGVATLQPTASAIPTVTVASSPTSTAPPTPTVLATNTPLATATAEATGTEEATMTSAPTRSVTPTQASTATPIVTSPPDETIGAEN